MKGLLIGGGVVLFCVFGVITTLFSFHMNHIYYERLASTLTMTYMICEMAVELNLTARCPPPVYYPTYKAGMEDGRDMSGVLMDISPAILLIVGIVMLLGAIGGGIFFFMRQRNKTGYVEVL